MGETDLISRQAAIDAIEQMQMPIMRSEFPEEQFVFTGMSEALQAIKDLPSVPPKKVCVAEIKVDGEELQRCVDRAVERLKEEGQTERKTGKWIHDGYDFPHGNDWIHCSECGKRGINVPADLTNYCPNCGADMRGEQKCQM